jgi:hypothetical protein
MPLTSKAEEYLQSLWGEFLRELIHQRDCAVSKLALGLVHPRDIYARVGFWNYFQPQLDHVAEVGKGRIACLLKAYGVDRQALSPVIIDEMLCDAMLHMESAATSLVISTRNEIQVAHSHPVLPPMGIPDTSELTSRLLSVQHETKEHLRRQLTIKMYEAAVGSSGRGERMKVRDLCRRIQSFHHDLQAHYELWGESLEQPLPDYPVKNVSTLRQQTSALARQLGTLKPYLEALGLPTIMGAAYAQWDAYDSAVSNDVAARKGGSIEAILPQLEQALGRLESLDPESDFESMSQQQTRPATQHVTNIYNLQGDHARVNVQSTDHSVNVSAISEQQVFSGIRQALSEGVLDDHERGDILNKLGALEKALHTRDFVSRYQAFINAVACHMTIILPFIPALTQMLGK